MAAAGSAGVGLVGLCKAQAQSQTATSAPAAAPPVATDVAPIPGKSRGSSPGPWQMPEAHPDLSSLAQIHIPAASDSIKHAAPAGRKLRAVRIELYNAEREQRIEIPLRIGPSAVRSSVWHGFDDSHIDSAHAIDAGHQLLRVSGNFARARRAAQSDIATGD